MSLNANDMRHTAPAGRCDVLEVEKYCECHDVLEGFMNLLPLFQRVEVMVTDRCA